VQNNFNLIAPVYDSLAKLVFGKAIQKSQRWLLQFIPKEADVLIIGGGTGWILTELLAKTNCRSVLYLEASKKMLDLSKKRYTSQTKNLATKVEFRLGTEAVLLPTEKFDVVFTGFLLDLFQPKPLHELMTRLNEALKPSGLWLLADFQPQNATLFWQKSLLKTMVLFFRFVANLQAIQLPDLQQAFGQFPLQMIRQEYFYHKLIGSVVYQKR
jgi:tRNA (cmo5U34)-methyltransferase